MKLQSLQNHSMIFQNHSTTPHVKDLKYLSIESFSPDLNNQAGFLFKEQKQET